MLYFKNGIILGVIKGNTVPPSSLTSSPVDIYEPNLRLFFQTVKGDKLSWKVSVFAGPAR